MARKRTRVRAKLEGDKVRATCLIKHPMETGNRTGADGNKVPIHYVKVVRFSLNGQLVATANLGPGVSNDPLVTVKISGAKAGDKITAEWENNKGEKDSAEATVK